MAKTKTYSYDEMNKLFLVQFATVNVTPEQLQSLENEGWQKQEDGSYTFDMNGFVKKYNFVLPKSEPAEAENETTQESDNAPQQESDNAPQNDSNDSIEVNEE